MKEKALAFVKLLRLPELIIIAATQLVAHYYIFAPYIALHDGYVVMPSSALALTLVTTMLVALGGFLANDYFDTRIDKINRPLTRVVERVIPRKTAFNVYVCVTALAVVGAALLSFMAHAWDYFFVIVCVIGVLWFYSSSYKRVYILGSVMVSAALFMAPMIVLLYDAWYALSVFCQTEAQGRIIMSIVGEGAKFAAVGALWCLLLDIVRGMMEEKGERELECHSICVVHGLSVAKVITYVLTAISTLATIYLLYIKMVATESRMMNPTVAYNLIFLTIALSVALSIQVKKSKVRFDFMICRFLILAQVCILTLFVALQGGSIVTAH